MKLLLMISLRNLFRQKRRNIFLGSAMAFGVMILVIANSFSNGIGDILFNKIVVYVAGHVQISSNEGKGRMLPIFRDKERLLKIVKDNAYDVVDYDESVGIFLRAIGNGKAENMVLVGAETNKSLSDKQKKDLDESFHVENGGSFRDIERTDVENPVILSKEKAKVLNVKKNDIIRVRYRNIFGQTQSSRLTVVGILSNDNIFMQGVMFVELKNIKAMIGYRPYECANISITLKDARANAKGVADKIQKALVPGRAFIYGKVSCHGAEAVTTVIPYMGDDNSKKLIEKNFTLVSGQMDDVISKNGVMVAQPLAARLGIATGQKIEIRFKPKFEAKEANFTATVKGIFKPTDATGKETIFMHEAIFYPRYYESLPDLNAVTAKAFNPSPNAPFAPALGKEWVLLERSQSTDDLTKKMRNIAKKKIKAATIDVNSMYESASDVLKLEGALKLITLGAVLVLFFIILIGVVNTLRMTIRERTREIGTIRAIGMQKYDVMKIFILETGMLTLFSSIAGTIIAFIVMGGLSLIPFNVTDNPMGILLVKQHLYFMPSFSGVMGNILLIIAIAVITAFFPSRRASRLAAADALRHYE
ncbi:MAG TPA: FtsX-like permease family protein [Spirochaetota bacterium]